MNNTCFEIAIRSRIVTGSNPGDVAVQPGDRVVVNVGGGRTMGKILGTADAQEKECSSCGSGCGSKDKPRRSSSREEISYSIKRIATEQDLDRDRENRSREEHAFAVCKERIAAHDLRMKLVDVEYQFEGGKITFYFTADQRVDFRGLVKTLASEFRTRIELRQIGVRDAAKLINGVGICGRPQCCSSFMREFFQISTQLAKDQQLTLNPAKISGNCGRLLCCLNFEEEEYLKAYKYLPRSGSFFTDEKGQKGLVVFVDIFRERIHVRRTAKGMSQFEWYTKEEIEKGTIDEQTRQKR
ncbi:MAG: PSP1 domain-containing protein [Fibrobacterota bacterium]|jgi:cell fate regulator YaaT (PSP1 superfamily)